MYPTPAGASNSGVSMGERVNCDFPPFSRVFVVCSKAHKEDDIRTVFQRFGNVEDVWMVKDRMTKESKGICYIKYDKASSAALAIEGMDGKTIGSEPKPIKAGVCNLLSSARCTILINAPLCCTCIHLPIWYALSHYLPWSRG